MSTVEVDSRWIAIRLNGEKSGCDGESRLLDSGRNGYQCRCQPDLMLTSVSRDNGLLVYRFPGLLLLASAIRAPTYARTGSGVDPGTQLLSLGTLHDPCCVGV